MTILGKTTLNMSNTVFLFESGLGAYRRKEFAIAAQYFITCIKRDERNWDAHFQLAMCFSQMMHIREAVKHLNIVAESCPDHALRQRAALAQIALQQLRHSA